MIRALLVLFLARTAFAHDADALWDRYCLACHGERGDGRGPAAPLTWPRPRDLTSGIYKWRSTPSGQPPTDDDIARSIRRGAPGTSMPAFGGILDEAQVGALVATVKSFAPRRFAAPAPRPIVLPALPGSVAEGRRAFVALGCPSCHGEDGRGAGAADVRPFDLTASPLRRGANPGDIFATLKTGLDGTAMPAYPGPDAALWSVAVYVHSIRFDGEPPWLPTLAGGEPTPVGAAVPPQGAPPASLPPAAASLSSAQCGRCHAAQLRDFAGSLHARANGPGVTGQLHGAMTGNCAACHAPLAEQGASADLRGEGVTCAACHLREHGRHGPPRRPDSALLALPSYPLVVEARFERSDFCLPCHQLPASSAVAGRPLLDTYREWLHGPYAARGVQCQHCHMPSREHTWKGVHDPETVRQGLAVAVEALPAGLRVTATNVGAGHFLPTTATPALWIEIEPSGAGDSVRKRIGRLVRWDGDWKEIEDTRIAPGRSLVVDAPIRPPARVSVVVAPDDYYEGFYRALLGTKFPDAERRSIEEALRRTAASRYVVWTREIR